MAVESPVQADHLMAGLGGTDLCSSMFRPSTASHAVGCCRCMSCITCVQTLTTAVSPAHGKCCSVGLCAGAVVLHAHSMQSVYVWHVASGLSLLSGFLFCLYKGYNSQDGEMQSSDTVCRQHEAVLGLYSIAKLVT